MEDSTRKLVDLLEARAAGSSMRGSRGAAAAAPVGAAAAHGDGQPGGDRLNILYELGRMTLQVGVQASTLLTRGRTVPVTQHKTVAGTFIERNFILNLAMNTTAFPCLPLILPCTTHPLSNMLL